MALVQTLVGAGPVTLREAARRVGRDVRAVHSDVHMLLQAGVLRKDDEGRIEFPYTAVHVDFTLKTAALDASVRVPAAAFGAPRSKPPRVARHCGSWSSKVKLRLHEAAR